MGISVTVELPVEQFPVLQQTGVCRHTFIRRVPGIDVSHDKAEALKRLDAVHRKIRHAMDIGDWNLHTAEQVHGANIAVIDDKDSGRHFDGCDGLVTNLRGVALGVHVADCCAVYIVDPRVPAIGLIHSGRKGTELNIVGNAIQRMQRSFGSRPMDLVIQLSPCIRPPHYEIDFAAEIMRQCRSAGVEHVHDTGTCTACYPDLYYSYRAEKGKTGRMLALLGLEQSR